MFKTLAITTTAAMIAFSALNPTTAVAENVQLAALQQAEHEAINIIHHLRKIAEEDKQLDRKGEEMKKVFSELRGKLKKAKNENEKKQAEHELNKFQHEMKKIAFMHHKVKEQLRNGIRMADELGRHLKNRARHLEEKLKGMLHEIEKMEKSKDKKMFKDIEKLKAEVEKGHQELGKVSSFHNHLTRELKQFSRV
ncbi:MAG: hypothetical protein HOI46_11100 [Rhodospirillaceae bacterium]|nr:hypothetical protein [Rhodospirillaceae bacterium]